MHGFFRRMLLLACLGLPCLAVAGELGPPPDDLKLPGDEDKDKDKEKPKEKPLKYSVWCAFRDLSTDYLEPKKDSLPFETRPISTKWMGFGRRGHWVPIILEIKNTTKDTVYKGTATIHLPQLTGDEGQTSPYLTTYRQDFEVAGQSEKQYRFSVLCPEDRMEFVTLSVSVANGHQFDGERYVQLHDLYGEDFVVVVSESSGAFRHLAYKKPAPGELEDDQSRVRRVAVVEPAELPARWHDLTLADLVILDGPPREKLSPAQWEALKSYAQAGGQILITAGRDPSRLKGELEDLAGISVREMAEVESIDEVHPALRNPRPNWKLPLVEVAVTADSKAASFVRYNKKTSYVEMCCRHYGSGSVTFLPFSLSDSLLENWAGRSEVPVAILEATRGRAVFARENQEEEPRPRTAYYPLRFGRGMVPPQVPTEEQTTTMLLKNMRDKLDDSFVKETPVKPQNPATVLSFLLFYLLCAVPGNYFLFGWFKRREVAWLAVPLWTVTFCIIAYAVGYMGQTGKLTVNEVTVVEAGPGQTMGVGRAYLGLYAPHRDEYNLFFPPVKLAGGGGFDVQAAPAQLLNLEQEKHINTPEIYLLDGDAGLSIERLRVQQRSTRQLEVMQRVDLGGGLEVRVKPQPEGRDVFNIEARNGTPYPLFNLTMIYEGKAIELTKPQGPAKEEILPVDASCSLEGVGSPSLEWRKTDEAFFGKIPSFARFKDHQKKRIGIVNGYVRDRMIKFKEPVVCAWIDASLLPVEVGTGSSKPEKLNQIEGISLLVLPVTLKDPAATFTPAKTYLIRYATACEGGAGQWQPLAEKGVAPLVEQKHTRPDAMRSEATYLELAVPENHRQLQQDRWQLRLSGYLGVAVSKLPKPKPGHMPLPPGEIFAGNLQVEILCSDDSGRKSWTEIEKAGQVFQVQLNKPWKIPPQLFTLDDHRLRADNVFRLRITVFEENAACPLELEGLKWEATRK